MSNEITGEQMERLLALMGQIAGSLTGILETMRPEAPNYKKALKVYRGFDWSHIGAEVVKTDEEGPVAVEWGDNVWTRRSGQGKFGKAIWFSRASGKDAEGNILYARLITFKDYAEAEPLPSGVVQVLPTPPAAPAPVVTKPAAPVVTQPAHADPAQADKDFKALESQGEQLRQQKGPGNAGGGSVTPRHDYRNIPHPWDAVTILHWLADTIAWAEVNPFRDPNGRWGATINIMDRIGSRQAVLGYLFNVGSSSELSGAQIYALTRWCSPDKEEFPGTRWIPLAHFEAEYKQILADAKAVGF